MYFSVTDNNRAIFANKILSVHNNRIIRIAIIYYIAVYRDTFSATLSFFIFAQNKKIRFKILPSKFLHVTSVSSQIEHSEEEPFSVHEYADYLS